MYKYINMKMVYIDEKSFKVRYIGILGRRYVGI